MNNIHNQNDLYFTINTNIYNHKSEVQFYKALVDFYPDEKDRNEILKLIEKEFFKYKVTHFIFSYINYKLTEIVWRSEFIEDENLIYVVVNINKEYEGYDDQGKPYITVSDDMYAFLQEFEDAEDKDAFMEEHHRQTLDPKLFNDLYGDKLKTEKILH